MIWKTLSFRHCQLISRLFKSCYHKYSLVLENYRKLLIYFEEWGVYIQVQCPKSQGCFCVFPFPYMLCCNKVIWRPMGILVIIQKVGDQYFCWFPFALYAFHEYTFMSTKTKLGIFWHFCFSHSIMMRFHECK